MILNGITDEPQDGETERIEMDTYYNGYYLVVERKGEVLIIEHDGKKRGDKILSSYFDNMDDAYDHWYGVVNNC